LSGPALRVVEIPRTQRLRAPLLLALWGLLAIEAVGGLVIFCARLVSGAEPGVVLHIVAGIALTLAYAIYQWQHWRRVSPIRPRLDYNLGLLAATFMNLTNVTGFVLAYLWYVGGRASSGEPGAASILPAWLSAAHNIGSMVVLTFVGAHLGAVLMRDRRRAG
jgi:hypothetical protein